MPADLDAMLSRFEAQLVQIEATAATHLQRGESSRSLEMSSVEEADEALEAKHEFRAAVATAREPLERVTRSAVTVEQRRRLHDMRGRLEAVLANLSEA